MLKNIHWMSVLIGILFALFVWPFITGMLARRNTTTTRTA